MLVNLVLLTVLLFNCVRAQLSFDLPIEDATKFHHEYDFVVIGAGSGCSTKLLSKTSRKCKIYFNFYCFSSRWMCYGKQIK